MNQYLARLFHILNRSVYFTGWSETEWKAFIWVLHIAYQAFLADFEIAPLAALSA
jgi:hypothetical protein